jgi:hypothetical protein
MGASIAAVKPLRHPKTGEVNNPTSGNTGQKWGTRLRALGLLPNKFSSFLDVFCQPITLI